VVATAAPWRFTPAATPRRYLIEQVTTLALRVDTAARTDTLHSRVVVTLTPRGAALDVRVDSFTVAQGAAARPSFRLAEPVRALGRVPGPGRQPIFDDPRLADCASPVGAVLQAAREAVVLLPEGVAAGARWTDTLQTTVCRDGVPLQLAVTRDFRAEGDSAAPRVARAARLRIEGRGVSAGDSTTVTGDGTATAALALDPATGALDTATGESTTHLVVQGTRRRSTVEQRVRTTVRRAGGAP
jgi:hypothetical protein